jgi:hypothetical protein
MRVSMRLSSQIRQIVFNSKQHTNRMLAAPNGNEMLSRFNEARSAGRTLSQSDRKDFATVFRVNAVFVLGLELNFLLVESQDS